jgi:mannose-1-phosphate guanylyltransferase
MTPNIKGIVLCAGLGTRLRPLTNIWAKPAVPMLGAPLLRFSLACLKRAGVTQVGINSHHLPESMESVARIECERMQLELHISHESEEILGTGGGIRSFKKFIGDDSVVVMNGDVLFSVDVAPIIAAHLKSKAAATMVLLPMPEGEKYNAVEIDSGHQVRKIAGKGSFQDPLTPWHFTGMHVISPSVFEFMKPNGPEDINHDVYVKMMSQDVQIHGCQLDAKSVYWSDLGTPERYMKTHQHLLFGQVPQGNFGTESVFHETPKGQGNFFAHSTAQLGNAKISGPAWFGPNCVLENNVRIGSSVSIGIGATVQKGAMLNRVAVLDGAVVEAGVLLEDSIVAPGGVVVKIESM